MNNALTILSACWDKIITKASLILSTAGGLATTGVGALLSFVGKEADAFIAVGFAILFDMFWGVCSAVKRRKFILSYLLRETFFKVLIYGSVLLIALQIERSLNDSFGIVTRVLCVIAALCELWSASAHILIIKPNVPFIRLFRKYLAGEIASKLKTSAEEVENSLNHKNDDKNTTSGTQE